jgi:hypothetical protein
VAKASALWVYLQVVVLRIILFDKFTHISIHYLMYMTDREGRCSKTFL